MVWAEVVELLLTTDCEWECANNDESLSYLSSIFFVDRRPFYLGLDDAVFEERIFMSEI